ncbi:unnamed protein product [Paramecium sonneborni]|uniref:Uncharacterized protein n=1 Tax=Paramecium sonneborni TaxID=65129 RepID=A0A8S1RSF6_9CILI|nr:unnamed protein product [Paramecium sonneborni]
MKNSRETLVNHQILFNFTKRNELKYSYFSSQSRELNLSFNSYQPNYNNKYSQTQQYEKPKFCQQEWNQITLPSSAIREVAFDTAAYLREKRKL